LLGFFYLLISYYLHKFSIMKKLITIAAFFYSLNTYCQIDTTATYCMIVGQSKLFSNNLNVTIDDGSSNGSYLNPKFNYLIDEKGKKISFETMVSALNFMSKKGWSFVDAYALSVGNQNVYHWILKRKDDL